ncbi:MAG: EF-P lysine aminoacylase GenX [Desulfamplus sp.]|nr:EF-P lysine aminoacylase GenX [Desulfamplus sp.]
MIRAIRDFFTIKGYLEVETPLRIPTPIPEEHIEPFESEGWYLQSSPEICMKRLAARGYEKIFQLCKCFRKDERGDRHLTELAMLEWYRKDYSYMEMMDECEEMIKYVTKRLSYLIKQSSNVSTSTIAVESITPAIEYGSQRISIDQPWQHITVKEAFKKYGGMTMKDAEENGCFDEIMAFEIEPCLGIAVPTFIYDYPASRAALAKLKSKKSTSDNGLGQSESDDSLAERFELYIAGIELANGFTELVDPVEQRERLAKAIEKIEHRHITENQNMATSVPLMPTHKKNMLMPEKFLQDLKKMPATAGIALGIDRLAMLFTNSPTIDLVVAFTPEEL